MMLHKLSNVAAPSTYIVLPRSGGPQERTFQLISRCPYSSVGFPNATTLRHFPTEAASVANGMPRTRIVPSHAHVVAQQLLGLDSFTRVLSLYPSLLVPHRT
ncbi:hypothetical protein HNY73_011355 [Argiope bruennichi]|uniref:Uncharacterized protein n=1 Tax=Argiope bruennichi TaxID=94029 RepID=A0A8T0F6J9_ARGBR|nr:hypothetical protein HNY73_011355 [Argiope bruennichi]